MKIVSFDEYEDWYIFPRALKSFVLVIYLPFKPSEAILVPWVRLTNVFPTSLTLKMEGALMSYQSFRVKGSTIFFLAPFLPPLERPYNLHR